MCAIYFYSIKLAEKTGNNHSIISMPCFQFQSVDRAQSLAMDTLVCVCVENHALHNMCTETFDSCDDDGGGGGGGGSGGSSSGDDGAI